MRVALISDMYAKVQRRKTKEACELEEHTGVVEVAAAAVA